jgi:hypothetical protein
MVFQKHFAASYGSIPHLHVCPTLRSLQICLCCFFNRSSDNPGTIHGGLASIAVLGWRSGDATALQMMQHLGMIAAGLGC